MTEKTLSYHEMDMKIIRLNIKGFHVGSFSISENLRKLFEIVWLYQQIIECSNTNKYLSLRRYVHLMVRDGYVKPKMNVYYERSI